MHVCDVSFLIEKQLYCIKRDAITKKESARKRL